MRRSENVQNIVDTIYVVMSRELMRYNFALILLLITGIQVFSQERDSIYEFLTENNKIIKLQYFEKDDLFIFEMRTNDKVELEVKDYLNDQNVVFTVAGYHRGGGIQNGAMDYNDIYFTVNDLKYDVYYVWSADEERPEIDNDPDYGMQIFQNEVEIENMKGIEVLEGEIFGWSYFDILPVVNN